jgi:hypothetical protein
MKKIFAVLSVTVLLAASGMPAHAYVVNLDNFKVTKNGSTLMEDDFSDTAGLGLAGPMTEPSNNGTLGIYGVSNSGGQSEGTVTGNRTFDTSGAVLGQSVFDPLVATQQTAIELRTVRTAVTDPDGLKTDDTFRVDAIVSLGDLSDFGNTDAYGIRLRDRNTPTTVGDDDLRLEIRRNSSGDVTVALRHRDSVANINTVLQEIALSALDLLNNDQVLLTLEKAIGGSVTIGASFELLSSGVGGGVTAFTSTFDIFNGEDWTRAGFRAFDNNVPAPGSALLFGLALVALGLARRRWAA